MKVILQTFKRSLVQVVVNKQQLCRMSSVVKLPPRSTEDSRTVVKNAVDKLSSGSIIALPTDTLYGAACLAQNSSAIQHLYHIKARDEKKPVAICVAQVEDVHKWSCTTVSNEVLRELLPGPVTLVFERKPELNPELNPDTKLIGIRIPDSWFVCAVAKEAAQPLALTSANVSGSQSTLAVEEFQNLWPQLSAVFDGGRIADSPEARLGSTVVDLSQQGHYRIIRAGCALSSTVEILHKYNIFPL